MPLDHLLLQRVLTNCGSTKDAFVPMPGGQSEPVAGASAATAAVGAPMGAPQGQDQGGGQPPSPGGGGGGMPPEIQEVLADPNVQQMLQQAGFSVDPATGSVIDPATGQPMPPDQLMPILEQILGAGGQQGAAPAQDPNAAPSPEGAQASQPPPAPEPMSQMVQLLTEIRDHLANGAAGGKGGAGKEKKQSVEELIQGLTAEVQRQGETIRSISGQQ